MLFEKVLLQQLDIERVRTFLTRHGLQKWWPHGVDTGCVGSCLQMPHVNWLSARSASLT